MKTQQYIDGRKASSGLLITEMLGRVFDEDTDTPDDMRAVLFCGARRIAMLVDITRFMIAGLLVTNGLWFAHWMGWL